FFFSSRRRHTRFSRDWSSDVCSSDLIIIKTSGEFSKNRRSAIPLDEMFDTRGKFPIGNLVKGQIKAFVMHPGISYIPLIIRNKRSEERRVGKDRKSLRSPDGSLLRRL